MNDSESLPTFSLRCSWKPGFAPLGAVEDALVKFHLSTSSRVQSSFLKWKATQFILFMVLFERGKPPFFLTHILTLRNWQSLRIPLGHLLFRGTAHGMQVGVRYEGWIKTAGKNRDTGVFLSMGLTGNLFCCSWKVINLHCERILLLVAILPCKVHYMEMLQAIKQKQRIRLHFKLDFYYPILLSSVSLLPHHLLSCFHWSWKLRHIWNLRKGSK